MNLPSRGRLGYIDGEYYNGRFPCLPIFKINIGFVALPPTARQALDMNLPSRGRLGYIDGEYYNGRFPRLPIFKINIGFVALPPTTRQALDMNLPSRGRLGYIEQSILTTDIPVCRIILDSSYYAFAARPEGRALH
jgi:hypothetical protein